MIPAKIQMREEIGEQPGILAKLWETRREIASLAARLAGARAVYLTGFGSSYHAALYGQFLFSSLLGIPTVAAIPSFFLEQEKELDTRRSLLIAISQSGAVEEVIEALHLLRKRGGRALAITNDPDSPLASACHHHLVLNAGREKSVPATKTFTATLFGLQLLTAYLGARSRLKSLAAVPGFSEIALAQEPAAQRLAGRLVSRSRCLLLAPVYLQPIAREGGLKLKECAYLMAESFEWGEFFHGPIALVQREVPALFLHHPGDPQRSGGVLARLRKIGDFTYPLAPRALLSSGDPNLAPITYAILLQLTAYHLALEKKINPDSPRRLRKVVKTTA